MKFGKRSVPLNEEFCTCNGSANLKFRRSRGTGGVLVPVPRGIEGSAPVEERNIQKVAAE